MKKRSFLARGEESLARLASLAKQSDSISHTVNTRNFVFQYIDPCTNNVSKKEEKAREEKNAELQNKVIICIILIKPLCINKPHVLIIHVFYDFHTIFDTFSCVSVE
jgi:hypothetical protein